MKTAPHLPPETCSPESHQKIKNLGWLLFFIFLCFLTGISAALITVAWIAPSYFVSSNSPIIFSSDRAGSYAPDSEMLRQVRQRTFSIYDKKKKIDNQFYGAEAFVSQSVVVSSDGWVVAYYPTYTAGLEKSWEMIDGQGQSYKIEKSVYDSLNKFLYLKLAGNGFRVMLFNSNIISPGSLLWDYHSKWNMVEVGDMASEVKGSFSIWKTVYTQSIVGETEVGSLLLNNQGELVGFASVDGTVAKSSLIEDQLKNILATGKIKFLGLPIRGQLVDSVSDGSVLRTVAGFFVVESLDKNIKKGDVLIKINGENINQFYLDEQIIDSPEDVSLVVLRKGVEVEVQTKKVVVE